MENTSVGRLWAQGTASTIAEEDEKKRKKQRKAEMSLSNAQTPMAGSSKPINNYKQKVLDNINEQGSMPSSQGVGGTNELG